MRRNTDEHRAEMAARAERRAARNIRADFGPTPGRKKPPPETTDVKARKRAHDKTVRKRLKRLSDVAARAQGRLPDGS